MAIVDIVAKNFKFRQVSLQGSSIEAAYPAARQSRGTWVYDRDSDSLWVNVSDPLGTPTWRQVLAGTGGPLLPGSLVYSEMFSGTMRGDDLAPIEGFMSGDPFDPVVATMSPFALSFTVGASSSSARMDVQVTVNQLTTPTTVELLKNGVVGLSVSYLPPPDPQPTGYKFASGTGGNAAYAAGDRLDVRVRNTAGGSANRIDLSATIRLTA